MKRTETTYEGPATGCLLGSANQKLLTQLTEALSAGGLDLSSAEYLVLRALYWRKGLQQCDICDMIGRDKAGVCRCVASLARKGLVSTESVSHKCLKVYLTVEAERIRPKVMKVAQERHAALAAKLSPEEMDALHNILTKIINE